MTDKALESYPEFVDILQDWDAWPGATEEQRLRRSDHIERELDRIEAEGVSPVYAALTLPLAAQVDEAVAVLVQSNRTVWLRLVEGAVPPERDPQGRVLEAAAQGKVLRVKIGNINRGGMGASVRDTLHKQNRPLFRTADVTAQPRAFSVHDAVLILRQWGYRVRPSPTRASVSGPQDAWLVVDVKDGSGGIYQLDPGAQVDKPAHGKGKR